MTPLLCALLTSSPAAAQDAPWEERLAGDAVISEQADPFALQGVDVLPIGGRSGLSLAQGSVLGTDGGTHAWSVAGRVNAGHASVRVGLPVTSYRTPDARAAGLGNLSADVLYVDDAVDPEWQVGASIHVPTGRTYTWVNDAEELWSGFGIDAVYQRRFGDGPTQGAIRTALGVHRPAPFDPFPEVYAKVDLAGMVDQRLADGVGLLGEASFSWWDVSPADLSALLRVDPADSLRLRAGFTFPVGSWAGWQPAQVPSGVRETTLRLELHTSH